MKRIFNVISLLFLFLFLLQFNSIERNRDLQYAPIVNQTKYDEHLLEEDTKIIKDVILKIAQKHIDESNFINRYFANKTVDEVSKQIAVYYNQITSFTSDPQRAIKLVNEIMDNTQAYVEVAGMHLEYMRDKNQKEHDEIKNKYCLGFFERLFDNQSWKNKATLNESERIDQLEMELHEIDNILKIINQIKMLFKMIDWTISSYSPFAWIVRKKMGW